MLNGAGVGDWHDISHGSFPRCQLCKQASSALIPLARLDLILWAKDSVTRNLSFLIYKMETTYLSSGLWRELSARPREAMK